MGGAGGDNNAARCPGPARGGRQVRALKPGGLGGADGCARRSGCRRLQAGARSRPHGAAPAARRPACGTSGAWRGRGRGGAALPCRPGTREGPTAPPLHPPLPCSPRCSAPASDPPAGPAFPPTVTFGICADWSLPCSRALLGSPAPGTAQLKLGCVKSGRPESKTVCSQGAQLAVPGERETLGVGLVSSSPTLEVKFT